MPRKRMIDPGIWTDPDVMKLTDLALIVFVGLISHADDEGINELDARSFHFRLGRESLTVEVVESCFDELDRHGLIIRYGCYGWLPNWFKHQILKGRKPQPTKLVRPPENAVLDHPLYVAEWESTYGTRDNPVSYPYATCYTECATSDSPVTHQCATSDSPVTHQCATSDSPVTTKRIEVKGIEVKGREVNTRAREAVVPARFEAGSLEASVVSTFQQTTLMFSDPHGNLDAIPELVRLSSALGPPEQVLPRMVDAYHGLISGRLNGLSKNDRDFWAKQPYTPKAMRQLWDRLVAQVRGKVLEQKQRKEAESNPFVSGDWSDFEEQAKVVSNDGF